MWAIPKGSIQHRPKPHTGALKAIRDGRSLVVQIGLIDRYGLLLPLKLLALV
jgi:hypothetical protein